MANSNALIEGGTPLNLLDLSTLGGGEYRVVIWNIVTSEFRDDPFNLLMP